MYDDALTPEEISLIYNGGEGDIGLVGTVSAPVVTDEETVTFRITFEKFEEGSQLLESQKPRSMQA